MRLPRADVNQNSRSACQSIVAARSLLNFVSAVHRPVAGSILTISGGLVALSHTAAIFTELPVVAGATCRPLNVPLVILPTSCSRPSGAGVRNRRVWPASSARKYTLRLSGAGLLPPTECSVPPAITRGTDVLDIGQGQASSRWLLNVFSVVGVVTAYSVLPSVLNCGA